MGWDMDAIIARYGEVQALRGANGYALMPARAKCSQGCFSQKRMDGDVGQLSGG
jgi:hypothetical protein